jgi:iron complex outermembrane recepter protein
MKRLQLFALLGTVIAVSLVCPAWPQMRSNDLADRSLEDLMNIEVTSVSKKEQKASHTAAAIFVISREDIRRSAANNIPDLLRMVPGLNVAQIGSGRWAISARGFNGEFSNKLLVLLDGRSVYLPTTSGVFWDVLDVPLEDIERIEVIRGPGGTSWGANAVNGVINIITSHASATEGGMISVGAGNLEQGFGTVQYGGELGKKTHYRVFGKYSNHYHLPDRSSGSAQDSWHVLREGLRTDSELSDKNSLSFQGDLYHGHESGLYNSFQSFALPIPQTRFLAWGLSGGYLQSQWRRRHSERTETTLLVSYDRYKRLDRLGETRGTLNLNFEEHFARNSRQDIVWGLGYQYSNSTSEGSKALWLDPADSNAHLFSSFVQDEIAIVPSRLFVTLGTKLEHNRYTGMGIMPGARLAWEISDRRMAWVSVSRVIHTPAVADSAMNIYAGGFVGPGGVPTIMRFVGSPAIQNEDLRAFDIGYRSQVRNWLSTDLAAYYNIYDDLATSEPGTPFLENSPSPRHLIIPLVASNLMRGETHGIEMPISS